VLPYFKRTERFEGGGDQFRGHHGNQSVEFVRVHSRLTDAYVEAAQQQGFPYNVDYNGDHQLGVGYTQLSQRRGWRASAARAYLTPARRRSNLTLQKNAFVTRIVLNGDRAEGVKYEVNGKSHTASVRGEVLLCAGALSSPKLLMLSGIGPAEELRTHGIEVKVDSAGVGQNLQEHIWAMVICTVNVPSLNMEITPKSAVKHGLDFAIRGRGAISTPAAHAVLFGRLQPDGDRPDFEIMFSPFAMSGDVTAHTDAGEGVDYRHDVNELKPMSISTISCLPSVCHPKSRGVLGLHSSNPHDGPHISHQLLGEQEDLDTLIAVCRKTRDLYASDALRPYVTGEYLPGDGVQTDEEWIEYFRTYSFRGEHPVGTCRMGIDDDSVVDPQLKVHGVRGLRVVDASVMPTLISGHTNAPTIMIAERAADLIRAEVNAR
jgi:choline dehydrogenase